MSKNRNYYVPTRRRGTRIAKKAEPSEMTRMLTVIFIMAVIVIAPIILLLVLGIAEVQTVETPTPSPLTYEVTPIEVVRLSNVTEVVTEQVEPIPAVTITPEVPEQIEEVETVDYQYEKVSDAFCVMSESGLTEEMLESLFEDYPNMQGLEESIIQIEKEHGVNAYYTLAVASLESGYGTSNMAINRKNLFGLMGKTFDKPEESVYYFGKLMVAYRDKYGITMTPSGINPTYCELDSWSGKIVVLMNQWIHKANEAF